MSLRAQILARLALGYAPALVIALVAIFRFFHSAWACAVASALLLGSALFGIHRGLARVDAAGRSIAGHLETLRTGDFSRRMRIRPGHDGLSVAMAEVNALGGQLREQRFGAIEASALLRTVLAEIDVALFAVDGQGEIRLANEAGARLLGRPSAQLLGQRADEVGLGSLIEGDAPRTFAASFPGGSGRWELRRRSFRDRGRRHDLVLLAEVSRALREEERLAWQRLVRVLGHELNNSLTPICSIASSLQDVLAEEPLPEDWRIDVGEGLGVVSARASALGRFIAGYSRLAQLPPPRRQVLDVGAWIARTVALEKRVPVAVSAGPDVRLLADADQLDQLLINLVKNAAEASAQTGGQVAVSWQVTKDLEIFVEDEGLGLSSEANLFVPFFTTKPGGSGIGLALSRQIAENHGGRLDLRNREHGRGCRASLCLPLVSADEALAAAG